MTHLMFASSKEDMMKKYLIKTVYDPACGTARFLTKSMEDIDDFLDDAEMLEKVQDKLFPKGTTLILSSDHYGCDDERYTDMILGIEVDEINVRKMKSPVAINLRSRKRRLSIGNIFVIL